MRPFALLLLLSGAPALAEEQPAAQQPAPQQPAPQQSQAPGDQATPLSYDLTWSQDVALSVDASGDDVVVQFDQPIEDSAIGALAAAAGSRLADLRWNDTSLVLRGAEGTHVEATASGRVLHIQFQPDLGAAAPAGPSEQQNLDLELALTRAQAQAAAGYPGRARKALAELARANPDDKRIQRLLADAEAAEGEIGDAGSRYRTIEADDLAARRIMSQAGGNVAAGVIVRDSDDFSQTELDGGAVVAVSSSLSLGADIRQFHNRASSIAGPAGTLTDVTSDRTLADVLASGYVSPSVRVDFKLTTEFDPSLTGASVKVFAGPIEQQARLTLAYRVPELLTPEQAILGGFVSRASVGGSLRALTGLLLQGDAGWNGYGLDDTGTRSETLFITASAEALLRRRSPTLSATYQIDAEYVQREDLRSTGAPFIPLDDRENHTAQLVSSFSLAKLQITAAGGWTIERFAGSNGPTANISAAALLGDAWRVEGSAGVSSISRPGVTSAQGLFFRLVLTRYLGGVK